MTAPKRGRAPILTAAEWILLSPAVALFLYGVVRHIWGGPWQ